MDAIIDVRITDTDARSYPKRDPKKVLQSQEKEKKKKYLDQCLLQRQDFFPFVVSVDGLIGSKASNMLKQLSNCLADKWKKAYSVTCGIVCSHISIACVRASHQCLRGSRIPFRTMSRQIQWEDGADRPYIHNFTLSIPMITKKYFTVDTLATSQHQAQMNPITLSSYPRVPPIHITTHS